MSEHPPPGVAEDASVGRPEALTPEAIEGILAEFRSWLEEVARSAAERPAPPVRDEDLEPIDLYTLLSQLTALRHEVHLQTRAVRAQQEQNAETLRQLGSALEALRTAKTGEQRGGEAAEELLRPLLKSLVDLYDSLSLAAREVRRVKEAVPSAEPPTDEPTDRRQTVLDLVREWEQTYAAAQKRPAGLLARWFGAGRAEREALAAGAKVIATLREALVGQTPAEETDEVRRVQRLLDSVLTGYTMSLQRVERALRQHDLEPIETVGRPFDPERMEAMDAVADSGRPPGEVVEEVRRGYLWRGRVFRYALVRVAKS
ncbi:MAG TPA: nucleotide exchange factor GrpE [Gemmataceae bacterium]|nr:nucleotide exchange factor GrpE [Gemmataceae bacterium]